MPHGQRDWSNIGADEVVHGLADMAELAARLSSPVTYNREGNVLFLTDMAEGVAQLDFQAVGSGAEVIISAVESLVGPYSLKITTSAVNDQVSSASMSVPVPDLATRMGVSAAILWPNDEVGWQLELDIYVEGTVYTGTLRYRSDLDRLDVRTPSAAWPVLDGDLRLFPYSAHWHRAKLVINLATGAYVRAMVDEHEYATTDDLYSAPTTEANRVNVRLQAFTRGGMSRVVYFDDLVVTHGEPA